jgi:hypothetical protein
MNEPIEMLDRTSEEQETPSSAGQRPTMVMSVARPQQDGRARSTSDIYTRNTTKERDTFARRRIQWPY